MSTTTADPSPAGPSVRSRSRKDRFIAKVVAFLSRAVYRQIEVHWAGDPPPRAPLLSVSNHFGGFSDALVLVHVLPRRPGIVARDVIWKIPIVGRLMNWVGGIPVHKPEDRGAPTANDEMFGSCYDALREGGHILIFPEGVTRNEPSIAPVKTGAARIALGARAHGTDGVRILPVGIHYEDKAALRSRVFVNGGEPLDLDRLVGDQDGADGRATADDRDAVRMLTDEIDVALRRAAPDYVDWDEAHLLADGAEIALRSQMDDPRHAVPLGLRDRLANTLADRPADRRQRICDAVSVYREDLDGTGFDDAELHGRLRTGAFVRAVVWQVVVAVFLLPFALVGALINVLPYLVVKAVGLVRAAPSVLATIKPLVAFLAFGATWAIVIWRSVVAFGWQAGVTAFVLLPVYLAAVVVLADRLALAWRTVRRWRATPSHGSLGDHLARHRAEVVEAVLAA